MHLVIDPQGQGLAIYGEEIDLGTLGALSIRRVSRVEADGEGRWWADLATVGGPVLGPFALRSHAVSAEVRWLEQHLAGLGR